MPLIIGQTAGGILVPILVDANGVVSVSAAVSSLPTLPAGDNNIGNVDVVSLPSLPAGNFNIGNVDVVTLPALPAGTNMIGHVQAESFGLISGAKHRDPLRLGYSGDWSEEKSNDNATAGTNVLSSTGVPAGEVWVLEAASVTNIDKATVRLAIYLTVNGVAVVLVDHTTSVAGEYATWSGAVTLSQGDIVNGAFYSCDAGNDIYLDYHARRIDIDQ